jgi:hypothetical protein
MKSKRTYHHEMKMNTKKLKFSLLFLIARTIVLCILYEIGIFMNINMLSDRIKYIIEFHEV